MKKILSLVLLFMAAITFTSCEKKVKAETVEVTAIDSTTTYVDSTNHP